PGCATPRWPVSSPPPTAARPPRA
ncbi:MAG: hypothetical protein AVDCRST_MAG38-1696, partial [uncultured Solirubrobacteraceae bacterium]